MSEPRDTLVIACGALAREIIALKRSNGWTSLDVTCLPAELHNRPASIPERVRGAIREHRGHYRKVFVAYADCGTGGTLDSVLAEEGVERLPGAHCYEFFATAALFNALSEAEPGTFYLTDFLLRHFDRLVTEGLGLDRHPELAHEYFRNYRKLVYLAQTRGDDALNAARAIAVRMNLEFEYRFTGYGELAVRLGQLVQGEASRAWPA
jgi:Protein of unknown function (DUF1638)